MADWTKDFGAPPHVRGTLHPAKGKARGGIVLTHGAGGNRNSKLLEELCEQFASLGLTAARCDLPYRQKRPHGPPSPSGAPTDRLGLKRALETLREEVDGPLFLGGSSYGGRQASMLAAEEPDVAEGLLLLSYPLHPPGKPERLRTEHFSDIQAPTLFVHGSKDAFGSIDEMEAALPLLGGPAALQVIEGASHGIVQKKTPETEVKDIAAAIAGRFLEFAERAG